MSRPYSRRALARSVADGHDTASAASLYNKSLKFIQDEQRTREYQSYLSRFLGTTSDSQTVSGGRSFYSSSIGDAVNTMPIRIEDRSIVVNDDPIDSGEEPIEETAPTPPDPTPIDVNDIIDDITGDIRVNLLQVREINSGGGESLPIVFLTIDGKLYYCAEGTYFNKFLSLDVQIGDETTRRETQRPTVTIDAPDTHNNESFYVTIPFSRVVTGFIEGDIQAENATISEFTGSGRTYGVRVTPNSENDVRLIVPANVARDKYLLQNLTSDWVTVAYAAVDTTRPTVSIFAPASYQGRSAFSIRIRSSEPVTGLTASDVMVVGGGISNLTPTGLTGTVYTADITPSGSGIITINIPENVAQDAARNMNTAAREARIVTVPSIPLSLTVSASDGEITVRWVASAEDNGSPILYYEVRVDTEDWISVSRNLEYTFTGLTNAQTYNVQVRAVSDIGYSNVASVNAQPNATDNTRPTLRITAPRTYEGTNAFTISVNASEVIHNLTASDITVVGGTTSNRQGQDDAYTFTITPTGTSTIQISIRANAAQDGANNGNIASNTVSVTYVAPVTVPNPASNLVLTATDKEIRATWRLGSTGGAPIRQSEVQLDSGAWQSVGLQTEKIFRALTNGQIYRVRVRIRNRVGVSTVVTATATPVAADVGDNVNHQLVIDFDNNIIGDPDRERRFWHHQGMDLTCAAVAVGSCLLSLGLLRDAYQVVRDATHIVDATTEQPLDEVVIDQNGISHTNTPVILNRGEALYHQPATLVGGTTNRYTLGRIDLNRDVYPRTRLNSPIHTQEENNVYANWNCVAFLTRHYTSNYHVGYAYDFSWLIRELEAGNKVIAFVDAYELWNNPSFVRAAQVASDRVPIQEDNNLPEAQVTSRENHALWITGIDLSDSSNPQIYLNDSGPEYARGSRAKYNLPQFLAAWEDAEFIYTSIGSNELPDTPTIDGAALDREHRELQQIIKLNRPDLLDITGVQTYPFFDLRFQTTFLDRIGIRERYDAYVLHVAQEQQRITDAYGLDPNTFKNVLDVLTHE